MVVDKETEREKERELKKCKVSYKKMFWKQERRSLRIMKGARENGRKGMEVDERTERI